MECVLFDTMQHYTLQLISWGYIRLETSLYDSLYIFSDTSGPQTISQEWVCYQLYCCGLYTHFSWFD